MNERIYDIEAREAAEVRDLLTKVRNGGISVVDLPDFIIVVEFDFAPMCSPRCEGAARADVFSRGAIAYHTLTGRPPVTNPFDLPSLLREGTGLLLSGTMNGAGRWLEEVVRVYADRSTAPPAALDHYNWRQHCRGLFQIPIAA